MKRTLLLLPLVAVALLWGAGSVWAAPADVPQGVKPVAVVSLSGYDKIMGDVALVGKLSDNPDLAKNLDGVLKLFTGGHGLAGLDKARPWGAVVQTDGREFTGFVFLPVTDAKKLLKVLEPYIGEAKQTSGGVLEVIKPEGSKPSGYAKVQGGWVFFADKPGNLASIPADPAALLGDLNKQYDVALSIHAANIPAEDREKFIVRIKEGTERDWQRRKPYKSEAESAARLKLNNDVVKAITMVVNDADRITLGWQLDYQAEKTCLEVGFTVKEGSEFDRQLADLGNLKSNFGGFRLPGAALTGNLCSKVPASKIAIWSDLVELMRIQAMQGISERHRSPEETRVAKELAGDLIDVVEQTIKSGRVDGGMAVLLKPEAVTLLAGGYVADAGRLDKVAKTLTDIVRHENPTVGSWVKLDVAQFQGVHFHSISIPIPEDEKDRKRIVGLIGERLDVAIGVGRDSLYVAAGRDAIKTIQEAMERSAAVADKTVPPLEISVDLSTIAKFFAAVGEGRDRRVAEWAAAELAKTPEADHVNLVANLVPHGVKYRLEVEGGILKLLGRLGSAAKAN